MKPCRIGSSGPSRSSPAAMMAAARSVVQSSYARIPGLIREVLIGEPCACGLAESRKQLRCLIGTFYRKHSFHRFKPQNGVRGMFAVRIYPTMGRKWAIAVKKKIRTAE